MYGRLRGISPVFDRKVLSAKPLREKSLLLHTKHMTASARVFVGGNEMNCSDDWNWKKSEKKAFEDAHPGMLAFIESLMKGEIEYIQLTI